MTRAGRLLAIPLVALLGASPALAQTSAALEHYERGQALSELGRLTEALEGFRRAFAIDPVPHRGDRVGMHYRDYDPEFEMGRIQARLGNWTEARRLFDSCERNGYTDRSENAVEFRRWRAIAGHVPDVLSPPLPTLSVRSLPVFSTSPPVAPSAQQDEPLGIPTRVPPTQATARTPAALRIASSRMDSSGAIATPTPNRRVAVSGDLRPRALPATSTDPRRASDRVSWEAVVGTGVVALVFVAWRVGRIRVRTTQERGTVFGRHLLQGLLGVGRSSFVYEARDRRTGAEVAIRVRRPDKPLSNTISFDREIAALRRSRGALKEFAPRLLMSGTLTTGGSPLEYAVMERLNGKTLAEICKNGRQRLHPSLSAAILLEIAVSLRACRSVGLSHPGLRSTDVFLVEPIPAAPGQEIQLKLLGLQILEHISGRDADSLAAIATDLFSAPSPVTAADSPSVDRLPAPLRELFGAQRRALSGGADDFQQMERALKDCTTQMRRAGWG